MGNLAVDFHEKPQYNVAYPLDFTRGNFVGRAGCVHGAIH